MASYNVLTERKKKKVLNKTNMPCLVPYAITINMLHYLRWSVNDCLTASDMMNLHLSTMVPFVVPAYSPFGHLKPHYNGNSH